jgi:glycosyltransferase involved in cell wall biosynthesis
VVFVTHSYPRFSGDAAGSFLLALAQALKPHDVHVEVLAPGARGLAAYEVLDGIPVHRFRYAPRAWETLAYTGTMAETVAGSITGKLALGGYIWAQRRALKKLVRQINADVVHAHWWFPAGFVARNAGSRGDRPLVITMHGSDVRLAATRKWAHTWFQRVLLSAAVVTVVSSWLRKATLQIAAQFNPFVMPMPVDVKLFAPRSGSSRAPDEVLFVGRLNEQKGLRFLLNAVARMSQKARLSVVGDGPDGAALRAQAQALGIAERVTWHGHLAREALVPLYQRATAVAIPSLEEGLGLVAVEAQLSGAPVVAFASGGLVDMIGDGETGLLVAPRDDAALAAALDRLLLDEDLRTKLATTAQVLATMQFSPETVGTHYWMLYRTVAGHDAA